MDDATFYELLDPATSPLTLAIRFAEYEMGVSSLLVRNPSTPAGLIDAIGFMTAVFIADPESTPEEIESYARDLAYYLQHPHASLLGIEQVRSLSEKPVRDVLTQLDAMDLPDLFEALRAARGGAA